MTSPLHRFQRAFPLAVSAFVRGLNAACPEHYRPGRADMSGWITCDSIASAMHAGRQTRVMIL